MKVCYVATDVRFPSFLGSATHVHEVASNLADMGIGVHVVCRKEKTQPFNEHFNSFCIHRIPRVPKTIESFKVSPLMGKKYVRSIVGSLYRFYLNFIHFALSTAYIFNIINRYGIDLILERSSSRGAGVFAGMMAQRPVILEVNDPIFSRPALILSKKIVTTNDALIPSNIPRDKVRVVSWGANVELFSPSASSREIREEYGLEDRPVVVFVGSFARWHGLEDLILASKYIVKEEPKAYFLIVGGAVTPRYFEFIIRKVKESGSEKNFIFTGPVLYSQVPKYINVGDVAVAPYNPAGRPANHFKKYGFYGSPLKVFEYMACGRPVVASRVGKIASVIQDGENGLLVDPSKPQELGAAIIRLLRDRSLAQRLGKAARKEVKQRYSWRNHTQLLLEIFNEVLSERF